MLELVRQLVETKGVCFLDKDKRGDVKTMEDLLFVGAMSHPGGGKNDIPNRAKRHFFIFNMVLPASIEEIFGPIIKYHFKETVFTKPFNRVVEQLTKATINLWLKV